MFTFKKKSHGQTQLEKEEARLLELLESMDPMDEDYNPLLEQIEKLNKLKLADKASKKTISPDALVAVAGSLGTVVVILAFEHAHVITSKALSFVLKPKI